MKKREVQEIIKEYWFYKWRAIIAYALFAPVIGLVIIIIMWDNEE
jgi:hypothetical protein